VVKKCVFNTAERVAIHQVRPDHDRSWRYLHAVYLKYIDYQVSKLFFFTRVHRFLLVIAGLVDVVLI
jgi:hypothetical protein